MLLFTRRENWHIIFFDLALSPHLYKTDMVHLVCIIALMHILIIKFPFTSCFHII